MPVILENKDYTYRWLNDYSLSNLDTILKSYEETVGKSYQNSKMLLVYLFRIILDGLGQRGLFV